MQHHQHMDYYQPNSWTTYVYCVCNTCMYAAAAYSSHMHEKLNVELYILKNIYVNEIIIYYEIFFRVDERLLRLSHQFSIFDSRILG